MRRFCQHRRRSEVNQAVANGVSRSWLKLRIAVEKASRCSFESRTAVLIYKDVIHFRSTSVSAKTSHLKLSIRCAVLWWCGGQTTRLSPLRFRVRSLVRFILMWTRSKSSNNACPYFFGLSTKSGLSNFDNLTAQHHLVRTLFRSYAR